MKFDDKEDMRFQSYDLGTLQRSSIHRLPN
jgi:hypothetical protein